MGIGTLKLMTELMVGSGPAALGAVCTDVRAEAAIGGTIDFSKKSMYAFLTGSKPGETRPRRPRTFNSTLNSEKSTTAELSSKPII